MIPTLSLVLGPLLAVGWGPVAAPPAEPAPSVASAREALEPLPIPTALLPVKPVSSSSAVDHRSTSPAPPIVEAAPPQEMETQWYGWQLLLADTASILVMAQGGNAGIALGVGGLLVGAPALHLANHNYASAVASVAVRGGLALVIAGLTSASSDQPACMQGDPTCPVGHVVNDIGTAGLVVGLAAGGLVFAIVDDTLLARVSVPRAQPGHLAPYVAPQAGGFSAGFGAAF
jgi:hypothetical protein